MSLTSTRRILFSLATAMLVPSFANAQTVPHKNQINQDLIWFAYLNTLKFNDNWSLSVDVQERRFINPGAQHQFLVRPTLIRTLGSGWDMGVGACVFLQSPQDPESLSSLVVPELRPHIEFNQRQKLRYFRVNSRYKVEARWLHNVDVKNNELADGYTFAAFRFRYRFGIDVPLVLNKDKKIERLTFRINDEILLNAGKKVVSNVFDNNRLYLGLGTNITPSLGLEVGYMNWFQERTSGKDFYNRNILRIAISQKINLAKKKTPTTPALEPAKG